MATIEKDKTETIRIWADDLPALLRTTADFLQTKDAPKALWSVEIIPNNRFGSCSVGGQMGTSPYEDTRWIALLTHYRPT